MAAGRKRKNVTSPVRTSKRTRKLPEADVIVVDSENENDEEDLDSFLACIKEQEESELLAKKLEEEWNGSSSAGPSAVVGGDIVDDEAMARELAQQWEDDSAQPSSSNSKLHTNETRKDDLETRTQPSSYAVSMQDNPPDQKLSEFRDLFTRTRKCTKCHDDVRSPRGHVMFTGGSDSLPPSLTVLMHAPCSSCRTNHCRGCFIPVACSISCRGPAKNKNCKITACCAEGRAIAIFEALGGFDRQYINERATSDSRALVLVKKISSSKASVGPGGTGYGLDYQHGYQPSGRSSQPNKHSKAQELAAHWDDVIVRALNALTGLLPSPYVDLPKPYDLLPHASIGPLLSLSKLPELLGGLLRNDSVTDWIARNQIYHAIISLLRRMADCELSVQVLVGHRYEMTDGPGLEPWVWGEGDIIWKKTSDGVFERVSPLFHYFKKLARQCEAFQTGALQLTSDGSEDGIDLEDAMMQATSLCGDIIAAKGDLERIMTVLGLTPTSEERPLSSAGESKYNDKEERKGKVKGPNASSDLEKEYIVACEKLAFKHVMLAIPSDSKGKGKSLDYALYNYSKELDQTQSATRLHKFRFHLVKELAVTATSLPPGVWVRADEIRNDAIKIMIAGPQGTPYAGGLFEFDCFIPPGYPNTPPLLHLRTTGGGSVRFNPNLYNSGKVCLSLLGTWPGRPEEQWSSKSTLLQVLVSIQSMILIDAPYYNEPGHGKANLNAQVSISYNRDVSLNTARWAIVDWLRDEHKNGIWKEVIASHFCLLHDKIRAKMVEWSKSDPRIRSYTLGGRTYKSGGQPASVNLSEPCDLLNEFELGMGRVRGWNLTGEE